MKTPVYKLVVIAFITIGILALLSMVEWEKVSGGKLHGFDLFSDIKVTNGADTAVAETQADDIDPELLDIMKSETAGEVRTETPSPSDTTVDTPEYVPPVIEAKAPREGDLVVIEDYTPGQRGLSGLRSALSSGRLARIGVIGDSYIEGDIFTQNLRELLQERFGGSGVGYMNLHSDFPGFRQSVVQSGDGWKVHETKKASSKYRTILQHYFTPQGKATAAYKGVKKLKHHDRWDVSRFVFISRDDAEIKTLVDGEDGWTTHAVTGSDEIQEISVPSSTGRFEVSTSSPGVVGLGVWLDGRTGIAVDCMSSRGFSGVTLMEIDGQLSSSLAQYVPYDLIILEFGINAMSAKQTDYTVYGRQMAKVIDKIRSCYPSSDILLMGVGDRGQRIGGEIHSMPTVDNMIATQRDVARRTGVLFWDTREAMGGRDAVVEWSREGYVNKDYVHLSHKGGKKLAEPLYNAITNNLEK